MEAKQVLDYLAELTEPTSAQNGKSIIPLWAAADPFAIIGVLDAPS